jgi:hypothetical protein
MSSSISANAERTPALFQGEKWLALTGLLGFLLAIFCVVWVQWKGGPVAPDGDISKAASFNAALGAFVLTTAAVSPLAAMGPKLRVFFRWSYIVLALYSYGIETIQNFRGVNPRFVENGSSADLVFASIFGLVALLLVLYYLMFAVHFFRPKARQKRPELNLGIRYAMVAVLVSFAAGIWISVTQSRYTGADGNIIWLHGLGFHALQAIPLVAWMTERTRLSPEVRRRFIHLAGISYLLGLLAVGWQTVIGRSILELSEFPLIAGGCFLIGLIAGAAVLRSVPAGSGVRSSAGSGAATPK